MITLSDTIESQKNLKKLCKDRELSTNEIFKPNAYYGIDYVIKKYADLPDDYPLKAIYPHGIRLGEFVWSAEMNSLIPILFSYNEKYKQVLNNATKEYRQVNFMKLSASPFLYVAELLKKQPKPSREGTIFFPAHSTHHVTAKMDFQYLAEQLKLLDDKYKPVSVCMYWRDFNLGHHIPFKERGMKIISAGHMFDPLFLFRLYHLCSIHKYAGSNSLGSHLFYSAKAGCSFFLLDHGYSYIASDKILKRDVGSIPLSVRSKADYLFKKKTLELTAEQLNFINYYTGLKYFKKSQNLRSQLENAEFLFQILGKVRKGKNVVKRTLKVFKK